jgi:hypothetical protein
MRGGAREYALVVTAVLLAGVPVGIAAGEAILSVLRTVVGG